MSVAGTTASGNTDAVTAEATSLLYELQDQAEADDELLRLVSAGTLLSSARDWDNMQMLAKGLQATAAARGQPRLATAYATLAKNCGAQARNRRRSFDETCDGRDAVAALMRHLK